MSMTFKEVVEPVGSETFLRDIWGVRPHHFARNDNRFASLLPWARLNEALERHRLDYPRLRLSKEGKDLARDVFISQQLNRQGASTPRLNVAGLQEAIASGAMLILDAVDEIIASVDGIAADIERFVGEYVQVNAYAGWRTTQGFSTHWDDHDVLVLQVHGSKDWRVFPQTREYPMLRDIEFDMVAPTGEPCMSVRLHAGDTLYIPRGWWHDARPCGEPTLHLSCSIKKRTGIDYVESVIEQLCADRLFRQDVPRFASLQDQELYVKSLQEHLLGALQQYGLKQYLNDHDSRAPLRRRSSLPWPCYAEDSGRWSDDFVVSPQIRRDVKLREVDQGLVLQAGGREFALGVEAKPLLEQIIGETKTPISKVLEATRQARLKDGEVMGLIKAFTTLGVIAIEDAPASQT